MQKGSTRATGYTWVNSFMANHSSGRIALFWSPLSIAIDCWEAFMGHENLKTTVGCRGEGDGGCAYVL